MSAPIKTIKCTACSSIYTFNDPADIEIWEQKIMVCPNCHEIYSPLPPTEREFRKMQDVYLATRNQKMFDKMYLLLIDYSKSLILKYFKSVLRGEDFVREHSQNSAGLVMENFLKDEEFKIEVSLAQYTYYKIRQSIFHKNEYPTGHESMNFRLPDGNEKEYEDENHFIDEMERTHSNLEAMNKLMEFIHPKKDRMTQFDYMKLVAFNHYLDNNFVKIKNFFRCYGNGEQCNPYKQHFDNFIEDFKNYLMGKVTLRNDIPVPEFKVAPFKMLDKENDDEGTVDESKNGQTSTCAEALVEGK